MIKKTIITVVLALVIVGATGAVAYHYSTTTLKKRQAENAAIQNQIADVSKKVKSLETDQAKLSAENARVLSECQKGEVAYATLPAISKAKVQAPVCKQS